MISVTETINASQVGATDQLVNGKSVDDQNNLVISTEQENYAQINSNNNSIMAEIRTDGQSVTIETTSTEHDSNAQTADGLVVQKTSNEVANSSNEMSSIATLLTLVGDKLPKIIRYAVMYSEAKKVGIKVVFLKGNREVNKSHLDTLWKSAKVKKVFAEGCYVVPLRPILETFPKTEAYDINGNQVTLDSPEVDMCLVVYDGQHRITVCELHQDEIDVMLELYDFDGNNPLETIKQMNSFSKNWNGADFRVSNIATGISTNKLYEESKKLQGLHGISSKLAEYILTFKREATKKKDLIKGKETTVYVDEHGNRGLGLFNAAITNFKGVKEVKKIEFMDAIVYTYDQVKDAEKGSFARNMKIYLGTMPETDCKKVLELIAAKDFGDVKEKINEGYKAFCANGYTEEALALMEAEVDKAIGAYVENLKKNNQEKATEKPLKSGLVHEVIQNDNDIRTTKKLAKATKKAQADVEDSQKGVAGESEEHENVE